MREKRFMRAAELLHPVLILAPVFPLFCMLDPDRREALLLPAYLLGWMLLPFAGVLRHAVRKSKFYGQYLLAAAVCLAAAGAAAFAAGKNVFPGTAMVKGWTAVLMAEVFVLFLDYDRLRRKEVSRRKALRENDMNWDAGRTAFERPAPAYALIFVLYYAAALFTACPVLCTVSVCSLAVYFILASLYEWMRARTEYLDRLGYIRHIPYRRIRRIGGAMLSAGLLVLSLAVIPCFLTAGDRQYRDLRKFQASQVFTEEELRELTMQEQNPALYEQAFLPYGVNAGKTPLALSLLLKAAGAAALICAAVVLFREVRRHFAAFRDRYDEDNGDRAETIRDDAPVPSRIRIGKRLRERGDERERVRREYRRTVRKHRKEMPEAWEMPSDIEAKAGIAGTEQGEDLHRRYEKARYAP